MKSKEEILSRITGEEDIYLTHGMIRGSDALEAMEEYALQQPGPRWVKASERLPKKGGLYHYKEDEGLNDIVFFDDKNGFYKPKIIRDDVRLTKRTEIVPINKPLHSFYWLDESPVSTPSGEGMAEALAKFFAKDCRVGDPLLPIIDSIYDDWKLVYDKLRIETSFSEAAIRANKFVIEKYASLSPASNQTEGGGR